MESENPPSQESSTRTVAAGKDEKTSGSKPSAAGQAADTPKTSAPDIMSKLPKSRPQRANARRAAAGRGTAKSAPRARTAAGASPPAAAQAKRTPRAAKSAAQAPKRATAARARTAAAPAPPAATKSRTGAEAAPSLPRLAWDGATEAAKLPLKVSGRLTLRALDAVARGLRGR